ncbi:MAG: YggS family pyridoxal phosphate-dependent enzyme [Lachnospiraceae bacterium]|nr:YggS family pyridoxal phosphate-dependent enzyme [Lachnospiraceae bacterium]
MEENIEAACKRASRDPSEVTLIAVSKTKPVELIMEAYDAGIRDFGENKVQELLEKYDRCPQDIRWHLIGHLQTNKVKYIVDKVAMIHSVDSLKLAEEISRQAVKKNVSVDILVEVNIADETTKYGISYEECQDLVVAIIGLPNITVRGLMCIAPYTENSEENRKYFEKLCKLNVDIKQKMSNNTFTGVLSMGMTGDYEVAIEEGATYVRVGTGIFGERNYNI